MRSFIALSLLASAAGAPMPGEQDLSDYSYEQYKEEFGVNHVPGSSEDNLRKQLFEANMRAIMRQNADENKDWFAAVNEFTLWSNDEFRNARTSRIPNHDTHLLGAEEYQPGQLEDVPDTVDWRTKDGVLTAVKNQGACGSCWAFSAVETFEAHLAIATGKPAPVLSEQQVVSCSPNPDKCGGTGGCEGSTQPLAFNYTKTAGMTLESSYRYSGSDGKCDQSKIKAVARNDGYIKLKVNDYASLVSAVATKGPVAISLAAGGMGWQLYGGGIYGGGLFGCGYDQDHGVQLVGYGAEGSKLYWIVRNSWGAGWGEKGFIRILRHGDSKEPCGVDKTPGDGEACAGDKSPRTYCGVCGIMGSSSYPTGVKAIGNDATYVV